MNLRKKIDNFLTRIDWYTLPYIQYNSIQYKFIVFFLRLMYSRKLKNHWKNRALEIAKSEDYDKISKSIDAGKIVNGSLIMHNGLKILPGSYSGIFMNDLLKMNLAVHEPEEELIFENILNNIRPDGVMLELGCWWGFYSMWFCQKVSNAKCFLIDADNRNLSLAKANYRLNNFEGMFFHGFISKSSSENNIAIDDFAIRNNIEKIDILHADIQGFEYEMLLGASNLLSKQAINYLFISTHSCELHKNCVSFITKYSYKIIKSIDFEQTHSEDGLIVAEKQNA